MGSQNCPICREIGHLIIEKPRKKDESRSSRRRRNVKHKEYESGNRPRTSRYRFHHYVYDEKIRKSKWCTLGSLDNAINKLERCSLFCTNLINKKSVKSSVFSTKTMLDSMLKLGKGAKISNNPKLVYETIKFTRNLKVKNGKLLTWYTSQ